MNGEQKLNMPYKFRNTITNEDIQKIVAEETRKNTEILKNEFDRLLKAKEKEVQTIIQVKDQEIAVKDKELQAIGVGTPGLETGSKIAKMIEEIKKRKAAGMTNGVLCPTCSDNDGHSHEMKPQPDGTYKCVGEECGAEIVMVDKAADYRCRGCGLPVKRPLNPKKEKEVKCLFCDSKKADKFDWAAKFAKLKGNLG